MFEWHFTFLGAKGSPFEGGLYHGSISLPADYPKSGPSVRLLNPSQRFKVGGRGIEEFFLVLVVAKCCQALFLVLLACAVQGWGLTSIARDAAPEAHALVERMKTMSVHASRRLEWQ